MDKIKITAYLIERNIMEKEYNLNETLQEINKRHNQMYDLKRIKKFVLETRGLESSEFTSNRDVKKYFEFEDNNTRQYISTEYLERMVKQNEGKTIQKPQNLSKRDRIITEYKESGQALSQAQNRHAEASNEIDRFNKK